MATRKEVELSDEQAAILESWTRTTTMPQGMVTRARIRPMAIVENATLVVVINGKALS